MAKANSNRRRRSEKPVESPTEVLRGALVDIEACDSLMSVAARCLREQDCDHDHDVANVIEDHAWPALHKARGAIEAAIDMLQQPTDGQETQS